MFKLIAILVSLGLIAATNAGLITTHHVVQEPALTKVGHSAPSAVSHQSITQVHSKTHVIEPILAPVVKTTVHVAPVVSKTVKPQLHTYHSAPVVHSVPLVHSTSLVSVQHYLHH